MASKLVIGYLLLLLCGAFFHAGMVYRGNQCARAFNRPLFAIQIVKRPFGLHDLNCR